VFPWRLNLLEESGETQFDALLERHLTVETTVLEAGCAGGRDAAVYAPKSKHWTGYDFTPQFLETARARGIQNADFMAWDSGHESVPAAILDQAPFDLIVDRRGPTSIVGHLPALAHAGSRFIYVGPRGTDLLEEMQGKLEAVQWQVTWSAVVEARGHLPTFEDYASRAQFAGLPLSRDEFNAHATALGFPITETKVVLVAMADRDRSSG
jgi:SAM-dependent methyltransferase